jgi:hypothetical protein
MFEDGEAVRESPDIHSADWCRSSGNILRSTFEYKSGPGAFDTHFADDALSIWPAISAGEGRGEYFQADNWLGATRAIWIN